MIRQAKAMMWIQLLSFAGRKIVTWGRARGNHYLNEQVGQHGENDEEDVLLDRRVQVDSRVHHRRLVLRKELGEFLDERE